MTDQDTEYRELCKTLRDKKRVRNDLGLSGPALAQEHIDSSAADAIESLQAEIAKLRAEFEKKREIVAALRQIIQSQSAENAELREHAEAMAYTLRGEMLEEYGGEPRRCPALAAYRAWKEKKW